MRHHRTRGNNGVRPHRNARPDEALCADPTSRAKVDRPVAVRHSINLEIVITSTNEGPLRDACMGADHNLGQVENENLLAEPDVVAHLKSPRKVDIDPWLDDTAATYLRAKKSEQGNFQR